MKARSVFLQTAVAIACIAPAQAAEVQVLGLEVAANTAAQTPDKTDGDDQCGSYRLDSVRFAVDSGSAQPGAISVLDSAKREIASQELAAGNTGKITAAIRGGSEDELKKDLLVVLLKVNKQDDKEEVVERVETDDAGVAAFSKSVTPGTYQIGVECGSAFLAFAAPAGGALVVGGTALAVSLSDGGSSGAQAVTRQPAITPPDNSDLGPVSQ